MKHTAFHGGRVPCLVGTARQTWHTGVDPSPEPLEMWELMARAAAADVGTGAEVIDAIDHLGVVHCQSWAYDHPSARLASALGLEGIRCEESILAGTSPQRLINAAAERMLAGECEVALVVGGEALATRRRYAKAGERPPWRHPHPDPPALPVDLDEWYLPTEIAHGVLPAWMTFALLEQARWAARGGVPADRREMARVVEQLNAVAVTNTDAWFRVPRTSEELTRAGPANRMVSTPYTKWMTAFLDVDMAAANLVVTRSTADRWGVPDERRVYLRGWGFARDSVHLGARSDLASSPAMRLATGAATTMAGVSLDEIDVFDLYSCFPSAVAFARDALGLGADDPRPITVTGGLPYHGGPSSNYMGHSISHLADHLRGRAGSSGLVTGIGMHMTKHVAAVWSSAPGPLSVAKHAEAPQGWAGLSDSPDVDVLDSASGGAVVRAATVVHRTDGSPSHAVAICELPDGSRCYARGEDLDTIAAVAEDRWAVSIATLSPAGDGTNRFDL